MSRLNKAVLRERVSDCRLLEQRERRKIYVTENCAIRHVSLYCTVKMILMSDNPTKEIIVWVLSCRTARIWNKGSDEVSPAVCEVSIETCVLREIDF